MDLASSPHSPSATALRGRLPAPAMHLRAEPPQRKLRCVVFDFDGTLSLIRGGWADILAPQMLAELIALPGTTETPEQLEAAIRLAMLENNGRPTIYQMLYLTEQIRQRGGTPEAPEVYEAEYLRRLLLQSEARCEAIRSGREQPDQHLIPGARALLQALRERGVHLSIASGTDEVSVRREAALLQIDHFFEGRIHGPSDHDPLAFSKLEVMRRLQAEHGLVGEELAGFGDGAVEIESLKQLGGLAVGIASDERQRDGSLDEWKVPRLIRAGADPIVGDYRDLKALLAWLGW